MCLTSVILATQGELFSIGMSEMEVATLRNACEFDMIVPDYGVAAGASTNQAKKKQEKKPLTREEWIAKRLSLSSNPLSLFLLFLVLLPVWFVCTPNATSDWIGLYQLRYYGFTACVFLCYYYQR